MSTNALGYPGAPEAREIGRRFLFGRMLSIGLIIGALGLGFGCGDRASAAQGAALSRHSAKDLLGRDIDPLGTFTNKATVLIFVAVDCPVSCRYAPELRRLRSEFEPRGISFWLVYPNADESAESIWRQDREYQLDFNVARDPGHELVRRSKVRVTPEAAVFIPGGKLVYAGRIDDQQAAFGQTRAQATKHDLEDLLKALLKSEPLPSDWKRGQGCTISGA
ncbi:MAG: redoxin family protein [Limisphaerales bacterium]